MPSFLKVVSIIYLIVIWLIAVAFCFGAGSVPDTAPQMKLGLQLISVALATILSIPAAALYAFGQLAADIRRMRDDLTASLNNLRVMRRYYEPDAQRVEPRIDTAS
jgi:hypothetical protein